MSEVKIPKTLIVKKLFILSLFAVISDFSVAQNDLFRLKFTAAIESTSISLDSIKVKNLSRGDEIILIWPDTVLQIKTITQNISDSIINNSLIVWPFNVDSANNHFDLAIYVPQSDKINFSIFNEAGKKTKHTKFKLLAGYHKIKVLPARRKVYYIKVDSEECSRSIKVVPNEDKNHRIKIEYDGRRIIPSMILFTQDSSPFFVRCGDKMMCIGYARGYESAVIYSSEGEKTIRFQFATNIPCPECPIISHDGQSFTTIQLFSQCWLKENLNVGNMIRERVNQTDNDIIEKYCLNNDIENCKTSGGLYQWNEMMQYSTQEKSKGICPEGWHIPSDDEWKVLEGAMDFIYDIDEPIWDKIGFRGFNCGRDLHSPKYQGGFLNFIIDENIELKSGFPPNISNTFWTSSQGSKSKSWFRTLELQNNKSFRNKNFKSIAAYVRCIKDQDSSSAIIQKPVVYTSLVSDIMQFSAYGRGGIVDDGGDEIRSSGLVWSTEENPTLQDNLSTDGHGAEFRSKISGLKANTVYYVRAYAINKAGIAYGDQIKFRTEELCKPCPNTSYINYQGQTYHTVMIGSQCWMRENLTIGEVINTNLMQTDNDVIEKYCYNDDPSLCAIYGGLYQWDEMMRYDTSSSKNQGICPDGWHIPSDMEWKVLEGAIDSLYGVGDPIWDQLADRGYNAGKYLKSKELWKEAGKGSDLYCFTGLPAGAVKHIGGRMYGLGSYSCFWSSTQVNSHQSISRSLTYKWRPFKYTAGDKVGRYNSYKRSGFSVRCLKDED